jgi:hypothetical protein
MRLKDAQLIKSLLEEFNSIVSEFSEEINETLEGKRQKCLQILEKKIKGLEHEQKALELGCGYLDSLEECPVCNNVTLVTRMFGGCKCMNPDCGFYEIAF